MAWLYTTEPTGFAEPGVRPGLNTSPDVDSALAGASVATTPAADLNPAISDVPRVAGEALQPGPDVPTAYDAVPTPKFADATPVTTGVVTTQPPPEAPSLFGAAFRQENLVAGAINAMAQDRSFPVEPDHNPWDAIKGTDLEGDWQDFLGSHSAAETEQIAQRIHAERRDRETLDQAGWAGTGASLLAGILDPTMLIPVGGEAYKALRGGEIATAALKEAGRTGAVFGGITAAHEAGLQAQQFERPLSESVAAIGGSIVLGALFGAGASGLASRQFAEMSQRFEDVMRVPADSAKDPFGMGGLETLMNEGHAAGAAAVTKSAVQLKPMLGLENVAHIENPIARAVTAPLRWMMRQDPLIRSLTSPIKSVREASTMLAETVLGLTRNAKGETTAPLGGAVETGIKIRGHAVEGRVTTDAYKIYGDYVKRVKGEGGKPLGENAFMDEAGKAHARFNQHDVPEVAKVSKLYHDQVYDPTARLAVKHGLLPEEVLGRKAGAEGLDRAKSFPGAPGQGDHLAATRTLTKSIEAALGLKADDELSTATAEALSRVSPDVMDALRAAFVVHSGAPSAETLQRLRGAFEGALSHPSAAPPVGEFSARTGSELWDDAGQSYLTRLYNKEMIKRRYSDFKNIIVEWLASRQQRAEALLNRESGAGEDAGSLAEFVSLNPGDLDGIAAGAISHILGHPDGLMMFDMPAAVSGPLKARTLRIPDAMIEEFLERNIRHVTRYYLRSVIPQLEMQRVFGSLDMREAIAKIGDEANDLASAAKSEKASKRVLQAKEEGIRDLEAMRDRMMGRYNTTDPSSTLVRTGRAIGQWNILSHLGNMTLSALSDPFRIMMTHGVQAHFADAFLPMLDNLKSLKLSGEETKLAGTALDMVLGTRQMLMADVLDDFGRYSKGERLLHMATEKFGVATLMNPWNAGWKQVAGHVVQKNLIKMALRVANGTSTAKDIETLAASSVDAMHAKIIAEQFTKHGQTVRGTLGSNVYLPNTLAWDVMNPNVRNALEAFRAAIDRDVDRIIITPGQDKPLLASSEFGRIAFQFKSFGFATTQRTILAGLQQRDAGVLCGMMSMLGMGAISIYLRNLANDKPQPANTAQWVANSIDASGLTGYLFDVNHFAEQFTGGAVGIGALTGRPLSRYAARNWADAVLGPTAGTLKDLAGASSDISRHIILGEEMHDTDIRSLRRMLPMQNLFYLSWLFRQLEQSTSDALGAKPAGSRR